MFQIRRSADEFVCFLARTDGAVRYGYALAVSSLRDALALQFRPLVDHQSDFPGGHVAGPGGGLEATCPLKRLVASP
jgi:phosphoenolpyruvate carboxylase